MQTPTMAGDFALPNEQDWDGSLEFIASEMRLPLRLIRQSAEGLAHHLRQIDGDPSEISAAEDLVESTEKMSRIVQALIRLSRDEDF